MHVGAPLVTSTGVLVYLLAVLSCVTDAQNHTQTPSPGCQGNHHQCSNGLCIPRSQTCDHYNDCGDYGASDETPALCSSIKSYIFCGNFVRTSRCNDYNQWQQAEDSFLDNDTAMYTFTAPRTTSRTTYLDAVRVDWRVLLSRGVQDVTLVVNIALMGSAQESRKLFWVMDTYYQDYRDEILRVPLRVDSGEAINISMEYTEYFHGSPLTPVNLTCISCISLRYTTYRTDCECLLGRSGYNVWKSGIVTSQYIFNATCGIAEYNEILFSLYDKCLGPASFNYTSPDMTSFLGDVVTLSCVGTGDIPPLVEWKDDNMNTLEAGWNSVDMKVVVGDDPQRFRCVLDGTIFSGEITVEKWSSECADIYFNRDLRGYRSVSQCYSSDATRVHGEIWYRGIRFNFNPNKPGLVHHLSIVHNSDTTLSKIAPLLSYVITIIAPGQHLALYYYSQQFSDGHGTFEKLNDSAVQFDLEVVPPIAINDRGATVSFATLSYAGEAYFRDAAVEGSATMLTITCEAGSNCDEFYNEWTGLEASFQEFECGDGLQQKYLSYQQCQEDPGPAPVVSSSASLSIEAPYDFHDPFPLACAIENAASYEWYRVGPNGGRDYITGGYFLIFATFSYIRDQGAYVCVGRGRGVNINSTAEYQTVITRSGITTLQATMTLINQTFSEDFRNHSSAAYANLRGRIRDKVYPALVAFGQAHHSSVESNPVRFYPGSVIFDLIVQVTPDDAVNLTSDAELATSLHSALSLYALNNSRLDLDPGSVTVASLSSCPDEVMGLAGQNVTFLQTTVGRTRELLEDCTSNKQDGLVYISRMCAGDFTSRAFWLGPVLSDCNTNTNSQLDILNQITVTSENVDQVAQSLAYLTDDSSLINGDAISSVADILDKIVNVRDPSPEVTSDVVDVVNNLLQVNGDAFNEIPDADSTSRIIRALESQISYVLTDGGNFTAVTSSLAVEALNIPSSSLDNGVGFVATEGETTGESLTDDRISVYYSDSIISADLVETSIELPEGIFLKLPSVIASVPISFILYQNSKLFRSKLIREAEFSGTPRSVGSSVISATVVGVRIEDLPKEAPVTSTFLQNQVSQKKTVSDGTEKCVFWDSRLHGGNGDWSSEGCREGTSVSGRIVCHCDHATSFAVLVDIYGQKYSSFALDIISKIGCGISIAALVLTIIIYLAIKSLRKKTPGRILVCFSLSLLCLYLVFLVGIEQTSSRVGCITVAVLMHYLTLASMAWMGVEATNLYLKLVKVFNADVEHFMIKASIAAWGLPMIVVGAILGVDYTEYENEFSCFLKPGAAFYYGQLLIIGLVILYNAIIFILVIRQLTCKSTKIQRSSAKNKKNKIVKRLQNMAAISVLLGLTWVFGLLSIFESSSLVFQVLFSVFNSLQGLFIFLLFVLRQDNIRERLRGLCLGKEGASRDTFSTNPNIKSPRAKDGLERKAGKCDQVESQDQLQMGKMTHID